MKKLNALSWALWIPGALLVVLGWMNVVPAKISNIGWWIALAGAVLGFVPMFGRGATVRREEKLPKDPPKSPGP